MRACAPAAPSAKVEAARPVSDVMYPIEIVFAVTPGALAVRPDAPFAAELRPSVIVMTAASDPSTAADLLMLNPSLFVLSLDRLPAHARNNAGTLTDLVRDLSQPAMP